MNSLRLCAGVAHEGQLVRREVLHRRDHHDVVGLPLMFAATGRAEDRVWHFNGKIERPRLLTGGEPSSAREVVRASVLASATVGDWDGVAAIMGPDGVVGRLVHDVSGRDHHASSSTVRREPSLGVRGTHTGTTTGGLPTSTPPSTFTTTTLSAPTWQPTIDLEVAGDTPSGVYAGRLRTDDSAALRRVLRPRTTRCRAHLALLMPTSATSGLRQRPLRLRCPVRPDDHWTHAGAPGERPSSLDRHRESRP